MQTFLGVPIVLRGVSYGNLYLTEKAGDEDFTAEDEELVTLLAAQAAVAIENARLYESATRWLAQLESLNEIGNALAAETELVPLLDLIATRLAELIDSEIVVIALPAAEGELRIEAAADRAPRRCAARRSAAADRRAAVSWSGAAVSASTRRSRTSRSTRSSPGEWACAQACSCRCWVGDRAIGVIAAHNREEPTPASPRTTSAWPRPSPLALRSPSTSPTASGATRSGGRRGTGARAGTAGARAARRDGPGADLDPARPRRGEDANDADAAREAARLLRPQIVETLQNVRRLAVELRPSALDDFGLVPALERLTGSFAESSGITVDLEASTGDDRLSPEVRSPLPNRPRGADERGQATPKGDPRQRRPHPARTEP
jgi:hypothetical protein